MKIHTTLKTITNFVLAFTIALAGFGFINSFINSNNGFELVKEADAIHCEGVIDITAGEVGSITGYVENSFSGACVPAQIYDGYGVTFDSNVTDTCIDGSGSWQVYSTSNYDATGVGSADGTIYQFLADVMTNTGGECEIVPGYVNIRINSGTPPDPTFTCSVSPSTQTIDPGSNTSYNISTTPLNGFNSPVTFTASLSPSSGTLPTVSFTNNGQVPAATTTANVSSTGSTSSGTYTITFTGNGGGKSAQCNPTQLVVNPAPPNFELTLSPSTGVTPDAPNRSNIGTSPVFTVFANCTGGFSGPVFNLAASSTFTGLTVTLGATSLACGATTTLTISNTGNIPSNQQSSIVNIISESLSVTGQGSI